MKRIIMIMSILIVTVHAHTHQELGYMGETTKKSETCLKVPNLEYYAKEGRTFYVTRKVGGRFNPQATHRYRVTTQDQVDELSTIYVGEKGDILEWHYIDTLSTVSMQTAAEILALAMRWGANE